MSPEADNIAVLDPTNRAGITLQMLEPLGNDWETPARIAALRVASVGQATYTENNNLYQLGVARVDAAKRIVLWELNPPGDATASVPGATLVRCYPDGIGCTVTQPITMPYTVTDSVSSGESMMTLHISTPTIPLPPPPTLTFAAWPGGAVPSDALGFLIPSDAMLVSGALSLPDPAGLRSLTLTGRLPTADCPSLSGCAFQTTATVGVPILSSFSGFPIGVSLSQSIDVMGYSHIDFRTFTVTASETAGAPPKQNMGTFTT